MDEPEDYLGYTVARLATVLEARIERSLKDVTGISVRHFGILVHLARNPGIGSGELARLVLITPQSMGGIIDTMVRRGLIHRARPDRAGTALSLEITQAGKDILARAREVVDGVASGRECDFGTNSIQNRKRYSDKTIERTRSGLKDPGFSRELTRHHVAPQRINLQSSLIANFAIPSMIQKTLQEAALRALPERYLLIDGGDVLTDR